MNREILFRGKPIDKKFGEWVEGFYMEDLDNGRVKSFIFNTPLDRSRSGNSRTVYRVN